MFNQANHPIFSNHPTKHPINETPNNHATNQANN